MFIQKIATESSCSPFRRYMGIISESYMCPAKAGKGDLT